MNVRVEPPFDYDFAIMQPGVLQHLDRTYTYDVVPPELLHGILFQGIHRPPEGTAVEFELKSPSKIYFFFHYEIDGGYGTIFEGLAGWKRCDSFPQYDLRGGDHGLKMVMYEIDAEAGRYSIPPTTEDRACFNIVFQPSR